MFRQIRKSGWLVFGLQFVLSIIVFRETIFGDAPLVFSDLGDGTKNLFTLLTYLRERPDSWFGFHSMNYPYGESIWYTDATPVVAIFFRTLSYLGISAGWLATSGFHLYLLAGIALSSLFLFRIFDRNRVQLWICWLFCLSLPWISPHLLRLSAGHFNLSLGCLIPGLWYWLLRFEESDDRTKWLWALVMTLWIVFASAHHLYFFPMLACMTGIWLLVSSVRNGLSRQDRILRTGLALSIPAMATALLLGWIYWTDPYLSIRPDQALGYNWRDWNLNVDSLLTAYDHLALPAFPGLQAFLNIETHTYLGGFVIWTMIVALMWTLLHKGIDRFPPMHTGDRPAWTTALLCSGWFCLILAIGEYTRTLGGTVNFDNWVHPFKLIRLFTEEATQFRCLGRFAWPVYWAAAIGATLLWDRMWKGSWGFLKLLFFALWIPLVSDLAGQIQFVNQNLRPNPLNISAAHELPDLEPTAYDALLPLPFYHVGSETLSLTIDPETNWEQQCLRASLGLNMPLISNKMSRTAPVQVEELFSWLEGGQVPMGLKGKKVLIMFSLDAKSWESSPEDQRALNVLNAGRSLPAASPVTEVARTTEVVWFGWELGT